MKHVSKEKKLLDMCQAIADKKGYNIVTLDVRNVSNITDYFIIAEGTVDRHVQSLAQAVEEKMVENPLRSEGRSIGEWIVLDYFDVIVHLFTPEMRERYQLENVWKEGKIVELPIDYGRASF